MMAAGKIVRREWTRSDVRELKSLAKKVPARQIKDFPPAQRSFPHRG